MSESEIVGRIESAFIARLPQILIGSVTASVSGSLFLGTLYWGMLGDIDAIKREQNETQVCQRTRDCNWHKDTEASISRFEQHIASGAFVRETVKLNSQKIDVLVREIYSNNRTKPSE